MTMMLSIDEEVSGPEKGIAKREAALINIKKRVAAGKKRVRAHSASGRDEGAGRSNGVRGVFVRVSDSCSSSCRTKKKDCQMTSVKYSPTHSPSLASFSSTIHTTFRAFCAVSVVFIFACIVLP